MLTCYCKDDKNAVEIVPVIAGQFSDWFDKQVPQVKNWLNTIKFEADKNSIALLPDDQGKLQKVLVGLKNEHDFWAFGKLPTLLIEGQYKISKSLSDIAYRLAHLAWGLGCYQFTTYKKQIEIKAKLAIPNAHADLDEVVRSIYLVRDLINTPMEDMGPADLAEAASMLSEKFGGKITQIIGDDLLKQNFPAIYAVGKGSEHDSRLIDLTWGDSSHPKVTLVGKGVCFDSGGLDIKPHKGMLLMKKDMGGAAHVLGLAHMIMATKMPVRLRVLIPAVENAVSGSAYHPGDVIATRKGISVEITNTDAEGRLVLADALVLACEENPDLLIDIATLTGAARVALGPEIATLFSNSKDLVDGLHKGGQKVFDPLWHLPLYKPYLDYLESPIADLRNSSLSGHAGAITAGLFLQSFVPSNINWAHFDLTAWNEADKPGRPVGAEANAIRAVYTYLRERFKG